MYSLIRKILFCIDPEASHTIALNSLKIANNLHLTKLYANKILQPIKLMGLEFPNRVGLAAGLDKNAEHIDALASLGFGFIEVGTVTPKPQSGNPKPRLFRLTQEEAIINRMGFNSKGINYVIDQLGNTKYRGILGINIGKNKETSIDHAIDDYLLGFRLLWKYASYITINISSPNTPGLRDLQQEELLTALLKTLKLEQKKIAETQNKYVPLVVKISPDLSETELQVLAQTVLHHQIDGVIATNTTIHRNGIENALHSKENGGLSGRPLDTRSTETIKQLHTILQDHIPIIASGGVMDAPSATDKIRAGAKLLQIYSGFIYQGPELISEINNAI